MEKSIRFLGIMILISSLIISLGGVVENLFSNRYEVIDIGNYSYMVFDKLKGIRYGYRTTPNSESYFYKYDYPSMKYDNNIKE
jgi:hypothetical protein